MSLLQELYQHMLKLNVVDSQREFSALWGKGDSWYSTSVARNRPPGLDALVRFHFSLKDLEQATRDALEQADEAMAQKYLKGAERVAEISALIWSEIAEIACTDVADRP